MECAGWAQSSEKTIEDLSTIARKAVMCAALHKYCPDVTFTEPSGGYFVWLRLPEGIHAVLLLKEAATRHGIMFTPATRCSL
ncbi:hypothetical protein PsorP6_005971 [Peronosclerospora sorghi]|uniref:Uncharacterized protein n=1 Tax=Peronosclerospora sorghi TaxID=230839 RepID=A0ACC0W3A1_9STRA|nr:hypothetical protein PsorP6_005971 [Peronosclerospora sorghi]